MKRRRDSVTAVVVSVAGAPTEITLDSSDQSGSIASAIGGHPTIVGQYPDRTVVMRLQTPGSTDTLNEFILPSPMDHEQIKGPIMMLRVDKHGDFEDFTMDDFEQADSPDETYDPEEDEDDEDESSELYDFDEDEDDYDEDDE